MQHFLEQLSWKFCLFLFGSRAKRLLEIQASWNKLIVVDEDIDLKAHASLDYDMVTSSTWVNSRQKG